MVINKGDGKVSNAVSVPIGQAISVTLVTQSGNTITVNGMGFAQKMTVLNFFNTHASGVVNLGGLGPSGPLIPLAFINSDKVTFTKPAKAVPGPSYVQMVNPPYTPFTSSGSGPGGSFTLK